MQREKQLASTELVRIMHDQLSKLWTSGSTEDLHSLVDCLSHVCGTLPSILHVCQNAVTDLQPSTGPKRHQQVPFALIHRHTDCAGF